MEEASYQRIMTQAEMLKDKRLHGWLNNSQLLGAGLPVDLVPDSSKSMLGLLKVTQPEFLKTCDQKYYNKCVEELKYRERAKKALIVKNESAHTTVTLSHNEMSCNYDKTLLIYPNPTGNCQLYSIAYFYVLLQEPDNKLIEAILEHIAINVVGKCIMFFDINETLLSKVKSLKFESFGISKYLSTNGTSMLQGNLVINRRRI
jgi:hypothetical protein